MGCSPLSRHSYRPRTTLSTVVAPICIARFSLPARAWFPLSTYPPVGGVRRVFRRLTSSYPRAGSCRARFSRCWLRGLPSSVLVSTISGKAKRPFPRNGSPYRLLTPPIPVIEGCASRVWGRARRSESFSPAPPSLRIFPLFYRWHGGLAPCACQVRLSAAVPDGSVPIHALAAFGKRSAPLHTPWLPVATQPLSRATVCLCCMSFCISARSGSWLVCAKRLQ